MSDFCNRNYKTLLGEILKDLNKWIAVPCLRIGRFNIKMSILPILIYRLKAIPLIIPTKAVFHRNFQTSSSLYTKYLYCPKNAEKEKVQGLTLASILRIKLHYREKVLLREKNKSVEPECPRIRPFIQSNDSQQRHYNSPMRKESCFQGMMLE